MDLIEYGNKFIELEFLIRAVYGGTEKRIYIDKGWEDFDEYFINAHIPNWIAWSLGIAKPSKNSKGSVLKAAETLNGINDKTLVFGFWSEDYDKKYFVRGFKY